MEKFFGHEPLFFEEPAEDEAGEQADEAGGAAFLAVGFEVGGELDLRERPEIPVGQLAIEAFVEQLDVEDLLPRGVEGVEVGDGLFLRMDEIGQRERGEDVEVATVGLGEMDVANEGGFFEDVFAVVDLVPAAIDDSDGEAVAVSEKHHDRHGEEAIDLAGDTREFATGVIGALQLDGDEDVGFQQAAVHGAVGEEGGLQFLVGELEDQVGGFPLGDEGFFFVERMSCGEVSQEVLGPRACPGEELVALVAEAGQKLPGCVFEWERLEMGKRSSDVLAEVGHGSSL